MAPARSEVAVSERPARRGSRETSKQPGTRERILDAAMRRFIDQGYDGTSLREIADDLGFTKAALYYHFQTKDQIFEALLAPMDVLIEGLFERLEAASNLEEWADALYWVIDQMHDNFDFFRLVQRNRTVLENVEREGGYMSHHEDMHVRFEATVQRLSPDVAVRVRLVTAIAAVTGFDDWAPTIMMESDVNEIELNLKEVVRAILGLPKPRRR